jgi:hypothetical protein
METQVNFCSDSNQGSNWYFTTVNDEYVFLSGSTKYEVAFEFFTKICEKYRINIIPSEGSYSKILQSSIFK